MQAYYQIKPEDASKLETDTERKKALELRTQLRVLDVTGKCLLNALNVIFLNVKAEESQEDLCCSRQSKSLINLKSNNLMRNTAS